MQYSTIDYYLQPDMGMCMTSEEFRDVPGVPYFRVSAEGVVMVKEWTNPACKTRWGTVITKTHKARVISPVMVSPPGYLRVSAMREKNRPRFYVHRLVALAWVPGHADGAHVNHINGIKTDNRAVNLEWVSSAENIRHAWDTGLCLPGEFMGSSKLCGEQVLAIRDAHSYGVPVAVLARIAGISRAAVDKIISNETWRHLGTHG